MVEKLIDGEDFSEDKDVFECYCVCVKHKGSHNDKARSMQRRPENRSDEKLHAVSKKPSNVMSNSSTSLSMVVYSAKQRFTNHLWQQS